MVRTIQPLDRTTLVSPHYDGTPCTLRMLRRPDNLSLDECEKQVHAIIGFGYAGAVIIKGNKQLFKRKRHDVETLQSLLKVYRSDLAKQERTKRRRIRDQVQQSMIHTSPATNPSNQPQPPTLPDAHAASPPRYWSPVEALFNTTQRIACNVWRGVIRW